MHPAPSLIAFTTLAGAGYGLLAVWSLAGLAGLVPAAPRAGAAGLLPALALIGAGLLASRFHLARPERALLAFTQWRTSWLSREAVAAAATVLPALVLAGFWILAGRIPPAAALLAAAGAVVTVACTGQIYAVLRPIPRWHQPLTTPVFLALAGASGAVLAVLAAALVDVPGEPLALAAVPALAVAWGLKLAWWQRGDRAAPVATADRAIGLAGRAPVRLVEPPHSSGGWLVDETGYRVARRHAAKLRRIALAAGLVVPVLFLALGLLSGGRLAAATSGLAAAMSLALALAIERWLFFAEARHTVRLWYGEAAV
ncbi:MAG: dimethyl sulfoxide reductase anchor subunit [Geminicoccaceae bacterium]|nr:dimethyl sulfoxide reductase anchor subunit [Geminicoccaceae bacterium]